MPAATIRSSRLSTISALDQSILPIFRCERNGWRTNSAGRGGTTLPLILETFWREAVSPDRRKIAWLSRRSAMEYAGFLEWSWRLDDEPYEVVDLTEVKISYRPEDGPPRPPALATSLGRLDPDIIHRDMLWDLARAVAAVRAGTISKSLATASFGKRPAAHDRRRQACVGAHFRFRPNVDVLCDGQLAEGGEDRRSSVGFSNRRLYHSVWRCFSGGTHQCPGREWSPGNSRRIRP